MKNKILLICGAFLLLVFLTYGTFAWYNYFLNINNANENNLKHNNTFSNSNYKVDDIEFKETGKPVYDVDAKSIDEVDIDKVPAYEFKVVNEGKKKREYYLYIEDVPVNMVDDGCTEDTLLKRSDLKYRLTMNGELLKEDFLSSIQDNILDKREIEVNKTNSYALKIYIHDGALDWFSKHYHYKVILKSKEE